MHGFDFKNAVVFVNTTNVMKGANSGVQKQIKDNNPSLYDVDSICHLADLTGKAGRIVQLISTSFSLSFIFNHSSKRKQQFADLWCSLFFHMMQPKTVKVRNMISRLEYMYSSVKHSL